MVIGRLPALTCDMEDRIREEIVRLRKIAKEPNDDYDAQLEAYHKSLALAWVLEEANALPANEL